MFSIKPVSKVLAAVLWFATIVVGLLDIYVSQFFAISFYARFFMGKSTQVSAIESATADSLRITGVLISGVLYLIFVIVTSEFHIKHFNQPASWKILGWGITVELLIIAIAYLMGPVTW
jgi:hypothetical protein